MRFYIRRASDRTYGKATTSPCAGAQFDHEHGCWTLEIPDLAALLALMTAEGELILSSNWFDGTPEIIIYDDYVE